MITAALRQGGLLLHTRPPHAAGNPHRGKTEQQKVSLVWGSGDINCRAQETPDGQGSKAEPPDGEWKKQHHSWIPW